MSSCSRRAVPRVTLLVLMVVVMGVGVGPGAVADDPAGPAAPRFGDPGPVTTRWIRITTEHNEVAAAGRMALDRAAASIRRRITLLPDTSVMTGSPAEGAEEGPHTLVSRADASHVEYLLIHPNGAERTVLRVAISAVEASPSETIRGVLDGVQDEARRFGTIAVEPDPAVDDLVVVLDGTVFPAGRHEILDLPVGTYAVDVLEPRFDKLQSIHTEVVTVGDNSVSALTVAIPRFLPVEQARFSRLFTFVRNGISGGVDYTLGETAAGMLLAYAEQSYNIPGLDAWRSEVRALATQFRVLGAVRAVTDRYDDPQPEALFSAESLRSRLARLPDPAVARAGLPAAYEAYAYLNTLHAARAVSAADFDTALVRYETALAVEAEVSPEFAARLHREYRDLRRAGAAYEEARELSTVTPWHGAGLAVAAGGAAAAVFAGAVDRDGALLLSTGVSLTAVVTTLASVVRRATAPERIIEATLATILPGRAEAADRVLGSSRAPSTRTMNTLIADYREGR